MSNLTRDELVALFRLAGPLIAAQLAHVLMVFTDTIMMGLLGPEQLAGGALGATCYFMLSLFCVGMVAAVGSLVAIRHGAGDAAGATRLLQNGLWLALLLGIGGALCLRSLGPLLPYLGQQPEVAARAMQLLGPLALALPGYLAFMALRGFTSAIGHPGPVMTIGLAGAAANLLINYALIRGWFGLPRLGLAGIGLTTALVSSGMALALALYILRAPVYRQYRVLRGLLRPRRAELGALLRLGLPIGGTYAAEQGMFSFATLCMGALGSVQLAAHQIALQAVTLAFILPQGLSYAVTYRVGQHLGAGHPALLRRAGRLGIASGAACMLVFALLFWLLPEPVIGLFVDRHDPAFAEVVSLAVGLLAVAAVFELFDGTQSIAMGTIRGLGDGKTTLLVGLGCYWLIGIPLAWGLAFPLGWGAHGVWWGLAAGLACAALGLSLGFEAKCARLLRRARREPAAEGCPA
ncbi:NorM family multidrug efflux MATE transporter [Zestomonas thermotolerans]|uniref:NorM family multidrug efflux MATE transporter n=1 Tax=Zestomonas thermotolerans TaxID=157784 RepID=UPI000488DA3C|nr:NorM family multidrug efflux MATE transporter [Pseudomonas thermotolerans]MBO2509222.1 MATE family efflux transporter [Gammaproteobacteria bacterium]